MSEAGEIEPAERVAARILAQQIVSSLRGDGKIPQCALVLFRTTDPDEFRMAPFVGLLHSLSEASPVEEEASGENQQAAALLTGVLAERLRGVAEVLNELSTL